VSFDEVDVPATDDEINRWWSRLDTQLLGFTAAGYEGVDVNCMTCLVYAARPTWKDPS
jgi:hypothetical protein